MTELVNSNSLWCDLLVTALETHGIKYACISPGSRNTPLVVSFQKSKKIKCFVNVDERSSAFFAIGLVLQTKSPVVIITTSGTAVAELYPAIIEAYYNRVPLIVITADRPQALHNVGANQTINQVNIFKNHVRGYYEAGMPKINKPSLFGFSKKIMHVVSESVSKKSPIHFNFPFAKPFEPSAGTEEVGEGFIESMHREFSKTILHVYYKHKANTDTYYLGELLRNSPRTMIFVGNSRLKEGVIDEIITLAKNLKAPIFADGFSNMRFLKKTNENIIINFSSFFQSEKIRKAVEPKLILQFGGTPVSEHFLEFLKETKATKVSIDKYGDIHDPTRTQTKVIKGKPDWVCRMLNDLPSLKPKEEQKEFLRFVLQIENSSQEIKDLFLESTSFPFEGNIINTVLKLLPEESNLMISNSLPARDFDYFAEYDKRIKIANNRGASGIDGIVSTAAGLAAQSANPTALIIGDLSFFYDLNGLLALKKYNIPLIIIMLNNGGGAIFETLPIGREANVDFLNYFKAPTELDYKSIVKGFGGNYKEVSSSSSFEKEFKNAQKKKEFTVLEIIINSKTSQNEREKYWTVLKAQVEAECGITD